MAIRRVRNVKGFTLMETLLVVSLLSVVMVAVMVTLLQGVKVFNRFAGVKDDMEMAILMEYLTQDLRNSAAYSRIPWSSSSPASLVFPSMTDKSPESDGTELLPAMIGYRFEADGKRVVRTQSFYPYDSTHDNRVLADNIQSLTFTLAQNEENRPPSRVLVSVEYGAVAETRSFKKNILIPSAYREPRGA